MAHLTLHHPHAAPQLLLEPLHHSMHLRSHQALATLMYCLQCQTWLQPTTPPLRLVPLKSPLMLPLFSRYPHLSPKRHQLQACLSATCLMAMLGPSSLLAVSPACLGSMADHALSHLSSHTSCSSLSCISTCCCSSSSSSFLGVSRRSQIRCHTAWAQTLASCKGLAYCHICFLGKLQQLLNKPRALQGRAEPCTSPSRGRPAALPLARKGPCQIRTCLSIMPLPTSLPPLSNNGVPPTPQARP